jgi:hypothetical protein
LGLIPGAGVTIDQVCNTKFPFVNLGLMPLKTESLMITRSRARIAAVDTSNSETTVTRL